MKILVTGATGFIGSTLTRALVARNEDVRILRRSTSRLDLLGDASNHVEHVLGDVTDPLCVLDAVEGVNRIFHTAAFIGMADSQDREHMHQVNVVGTAHVVNAALRAGVERLVHTSSIAAFGRPGQAGTLIDEETPWEPSRSNTAYARSKHASEMEIHRGIAEGLDAVLVNPSVVFGVGRPGENTRIIVDRVRRRAVPFVPSGGTNVVDVEDVAEGHLRAMDRGRTGERYLLGGENLTWREILGTLADAFDVPRPRRVLPPGVAFSIGALGEAVAFLTRTRPLVTRRLARQTARFDRYDHTKAVSELGCSFRPFAATAQRIARAFDEDGG